MTSTSRAPAVRLGLLAVLAVLAWISTVDRMQGMDAGPGTELGGLGWFAGAWVVMTAAMMVPSILPKAVVDSRVRTGVFASALFLGGYLLTWTAAGLAGYALFETLRALDIGFLAWGEGGRSVAAAVLLGAALYELSPVKDACLSACRRPLEPRRTGPVGALRTGIAHGAWCVGSSWALMAALFALGVMSVAWMALIAALIAAEKLLPWKAVATRGATAVLLALAIGVAVSPEDVPGLTLPSSSEAAPPMDGMGATAPFLVSAHHVVRL